MQTRLAVLGEQSTLRDHIAEFWQKISLINGIFHVAKYGKSTTQARIGFGQFFLIHGDFLYARCRSFGFSFAIRNTSPAASGVS